MRNSYPRSHTDVVLGGAADSAVLSMLSRSTSRVRCSRALHSVVLGCSRALHSVVLGCSRALHVASVHDFPRAQPHPPAIAMSWLASMV